MEDLGGLDGLEGLVGQLKEPTLSFFPTLVNTLGSSILDTRYAYELRLSVSILVVLSLYYGIARKISFL